MIDNSASTRFFSFRAVVFESALGVLAVLIGWLVGQSPLATLHVNRYSVMGGVVAALPPLGLLWLGSRWNWRPFREVWRALDDWIAPLFRECNWIELAAIAFMAGVGEEMLFRGILQAGVAQWSGEFLPHTHSGAMLGNWLAVFVVAIAFGLLHAVNASYAVLAALIGAYLGWLWMVTGNLTVPILAHATYDFVALLYLVHGRRGLRSDFPGH
jgi:membrane protease YdiL (CAAX protease family)